MATTRDVQAQQQAAAGWAFDPDQVQVETPSGVDPKSSAAKLASRVREDEQATAKARNELLERLQAERKRRKAERAKTAGLTTAEILAARRLGTG